MTANVLHKNLMTLLTGACLMSTLTSCGGKVHDGGGLPAKVPFIDTPKPTPKPVIKEEPIELGLVGRYKVSFNALNTAVAGMSDGFAQIQVMADLFSISVKIKDTHVTTGHSQSIYSGTRCPSDRDDVNGDGYIDAVEASKVIGMALIPLDSNIQSQEEGLNEFPMSDLIGGYTWHRDGSLSKMIADLSSPDVDANDQLAKLDFGKELKLEDKVIVIHGVHNDIILAGSIQVFPGTYDRASLPIACGKITRIMIPETLTVHPEE